MAGKDIQFLSSTPVIPSCLDITSKGLSFTSEWFTPNHQYIAARAPLLASELPIAEKSQAKNQAFLS